MEPTPALPDELLLAGWSQAPSGLFVPDRRHRPLRAADIFAGCGGFSLGMQGAGTWEWLLKRGAVAAELADWLDANQREGELVQDPFAGLGTVPMFAIKLRRRGLGIELNPTSFGDAAAHCAATARQLSMPSLLDLMRVEDDPHEEAGAVEEEIA